MDLLEYGDIVTPVDDPCQYNPAWRSILSQYLFANGRWDKDGLSYLSKTGCVTVTRTVTREVSEDDKSSKSHKSNKSAKKKKKSNKKTVTVTEKIYTPLHPFDTNPEYRTFALDEWIMKKLMFMNDNADGVPTTDENVPLKLAQRWYEEVDNESAMKKRIEALLLTEIGIDVITMDLIGLPSSQPAIEAYERLYFNCRDANFDPHPSTQLRMKMAMPWGPLKAFLRKWEVLDSDGFCVQDGRPIAKDSDVWKAVGATMGYEALIYLWRWERTAHGLKDTSLMHMMEISWKSSISRLLSDLFTGTIAHEDVARVLAAYSSHMKYISDDRKDGGEGGEMAEAFLSLLGVAAPKMRELVSGGAGMITDNDIQARIESQQAIDKTNIQDAGKQVANEIIDAQISEAIER